MKLEVCFYRGIGLQKSESGILGQDIPRQTKEMGGGKWIKAQNIFSKERKRLIWGNK